MQSPNPGTRYTHLGIVSSTPGFRATVYYNASGHPKTLGKWTEVKAVSVTKTRKRVFLPSAARSASYYLLVIDSRGSVRINEIQLLF